MRLVARNNCLANFHYQKIFDYISLYFYRFSYQGVVYCYYGSLISQASFSGSWQSWCSVI